MNITIHGKCRPVKPEDCPKPENLIQMSADVNAAPKFDGEYKRGQLAAFAAIYGGKNDAK